MKNKKKLQNYSFVESVSGVGS